MYYFLLKLHQWKKSIRLLKKVRPIYRKHQSQTTQKTIGLFLRINHSFHSLKVNAAINCVKIFMLIVSNFSYLIKPCNWSKLNALLQLKIIYFLHESTKCNFSAVSSIKVMPENVLRKILSWTSLQLLITNFLQYESAWSPLNSTKIRKSFLFCD